MNESEFRPLAGAFGAEAAGVDLHQDPDHGRKQRLREAWHKHALLLFRGQAGLSEDRLSRVAQIFGEISNEGEYPKYVSNVVPDSLTPEGELLFHMDFSWSERPLRGLMLYAYEVPPEGAGGETLFANAQIAYALLPPALRERIATLSIVHSTTTVTAERPRITSTHPIAFRHPVTGEMVLYCSPRHFFGIPGLSAGEGQALCDELATYLYRPEVIHKHVWRAGDVAVWDNLKLQHARTDWDPKYPRHLHRIQIAAPAPVFA